MDETNTYLGIILRRFFDKFQNITYHGVPICKYIYFPFVRYFPSRWSLAWAKENLPYWKEDSSRLNETEIHSWSDAPYHYKPHPGGVILMRGGFGDIASLHLPPERYFLICPNQAEVDLIKTNRPDLQAQSIEDYYHDNPQAVNQLIGQFAQVINAQKDDPILGSPDLLQWFTERMPDVVQMLDAVQSLFDTLNISAVLSILSINTGNGMDSALNLVARFHQIPSFTQQHGVITDIALFGLVPVLATKKLIWGTAVRDWFKKYGVPESRVSVIGSPHFEIIFNRKWWNKQELCKALNIDPAMNVIIYATGTDRQTIVPIILEGLKSIPNLFLVLSLHPSESSAIEEYQKLTEGYSNCKVVRFGHLSLYDELSGGDLFITHCSTAAMEAMLFKLPVITVEPTTPYFSYGDLGASLCVTNSTELNQVVTSLISDEAFKAEAIQKYQKFISEYCIPDELASKRLFDEINSLCHTEGIA